MSQYPTKHEYEKALKTVKAYEYRQAQLQKLRDELATKLQLFKSVSFKVNKKQKEVSFSGYLESKNKVVMGSSKCANVDKFEEVIGKLIAVKKSLNEDVAEVVKLVESAGIVTDSILHWGLTPIYAKPQTFI